MANRATVQPAVPPPSDKKRTIDELFDSLSKREEEYERRQAEKQRLFQAEQKKAIEMKKEAFECFFEYLLEHGPIYMTGICDGHKQLGPLGSGKDIQSLCEKLHTARLCSDDVSRYAKELGYVIQCHECGYFLTSTCFICNTTRCPLSKLWHCMWDIKKKQ